MNKHFIKYILLVFMLIACKRDNANKDNSIVDQHSEKGKTVQAKTQKAQPQEAKVKIYFENTLSMDGYINGNTDFKNVLRELLVAVDNEDELNFDTEFFLVNNKLIQEDFGGESIKITEKLNPKSTSNKGNKGSSDFEEVIDEVLQNHSEDDITIITADFIYSPKGEPDTPSALSKLKTYTENAFLKATSKFEGLETRIYQFESSFNGTYYDIDNKSISGINNRPYYYFVIASSSLMSFFDENVGEELKKNATFQNEVFFTKAKYTEGINFHVLTSTAKNGRFRFMSGKLKIFNYPENDSLKFTVLMDFDNLPLSNSYLMNPNNYLLNNSNFRVKNIGLKKNKKINFKGETPIKITEVDYSSIKNQNYTHAIQFEVQGKENSVLGFSLNKRIPIWVENINSKNDRNILLDSLEQKKTFGFLNLVEGISDAYLKKSDENHFFEIKIPIENN